MKCETVKSETCELLATLAFVACCITVLPAAAQELNVCPGLTVGAPGGPPIAVYSDCTVESMGMPG